MSAPTPDTRLSELEDDVRELVSSVIQLQAQVTQLRAARTQDAARYVASTPDSIKVPHSSSAVLGYALLELHEGRWDFASFDSPADSLSDFEGLEQNEVVAALVRIAPDGTIGGQT